MCKQPSPFTAGNDHTNAMVNFLPDMSVGYVEGYRLAADLLVQHVDRTNSEHDFLVYPIVYMYRHHYELQMKQIIVVGRKALRDAPTKLNTHRLANLWPIARDLIVRAEPESDEPEELAQLDEFVKQLADIDEDAQAFRFPKLTSGKKSLEGVTHINLNCLRVTADGLSKFLWGAEAYFREMLQFESEMH